MKNKNKEGRGKRKKGGVRGEKEPTLKYGGGEGKDGQITTKVTCSNGVCTH